MTNSEKMIHGNDLAIAILEAMNNAAELILTNGDGDSIKKWQAQYLLTTAFNEMLGKINVSIDRPTKQLNPFYSADEISHLRGGKIIGIVDADSNDPESGMTSDCLIIEIEKDGEFHELVFQEGEWFTLSFAETEE